MYGEKERFAELLTRTLTVFQWAVYKKYGADKADFGELYALAAMKLREKGGFEEMEETLRGLGLEIECEF